MVFFDTSPLTFSPSPLLFFFFFFTAQVLRLFASRDILSAPVIECPSSSTSSPPNARCLGFVSVEDILRAVLGFAGFSASPSSASSSSSSSTDPSLLDAAVLASSTPAAREEGLRRASERLRSTSVREIQREGDGRLVFRCVEGSKGGGGEGERNGRTAPAPPPSGETSLLDVVRDGFLLGGDRGSPACHRVAVVDFEDDDDFEDEEGEEDGDDDETTRAAPQAPPPGGEGDGPGSSDPLRVVAIVSQSDVVRFLARHLGELRKSGSEGGREGEKGEKESEEEPTARELASAPVAAVAAAMPASLALASLFERRGRVSAAAILGARHGELVGSLSASDLRGLVLGGGAGGPGSSSLRALGLPVGEFLEARAEAARAAAAAAASVDDDGGEPEAARRAVPPPLLAVGPTRPSPSWCGCSPKGGTTGRTSWRGEEEVRREQRRRRRDRGGRWG